MDVSIVVPVYNSEATLDRLVDSLTSQTGCEAISYEILLVDDGSTDGSLKKCEELAGKHPQIRVLSQKNQGPSAARNLGLDNADGEYVLFSDADDYIETDTVASLLGVARDGQADLVIFGLYDEIWDGDQRISREEHHGPARAYSSCTELLADFHVLLDNNLLYSQCTKMYRRALLNSNHVRFDESLSMGEDISFNLAFFPYAGRAVITQQCLYHYVHVVRSGSVSSVYCPGYYQNVCAVQQKEEALLRRFDSFTPQNRQSLHNFFLGRVSSAVQNELSKEGRRFREEYRDVREIASSGQALSAAKNQSASNRFHRTLAFFIRHRLTFLLTLLFLLLRKIKGGNQGMLMKMKNMAQ